MLNKASEQTVISADWFNRIVCLIHKKESKDDPLNCRGSAFVNHKVKLFTSVIWRLLKKWIKAAEIITDELDLSKLWNNPDSQFIVGPIKNLKAALSILLYK